MAAPPLVSVVLCAYNYAQYLGEAIESALDQTHPAVEVIVVDDGSTDETPEVVARYADSVRSVRRPNGGLNAATTTGFEHARGELWTLLDADDTWPRDRVALLVEALDGAPQAGLAFGDMEIVDADGALVASSFREHYGIVATQGDVLPRLICANFISAGSLMVRASLAERFMPIPPDVPYNDWWIGARIAPVAEVVAIDAVVNRYRHHGANMNLGATDAKRIGLLRSELGFRRRMLQEIAPDAVAPIHLLTAVATLDATVAEVAAFDGVGRDALMPVGPDEHRAARGAMAQARAALETADFTGAIGWVVRGLAHNPDMPGARTLLNELHPLAAAA